jgi:predicted nucleic acid-binding protein
MTRSKTIEFGLLDTSVVIDLHKIDVSLLPSEMGISALTLAELSAGPHATKDPDERARRQELLQRVESVFDPFPFDLAAARMYGRIASVVLQQGRTPRGMRAVDFMIAATAASLQVPLFTRNPADISGLESIVGTVVV